MKVLGIVGWSGSGKTTLICRLLPALRARGLNVSTVKHTHHDIEPDAPGKDSRRHREAGAVEVLLVGPHRTILVHDWPDAGTPSLPDLPDLLARLQPVDLVLVEGFKGSGQPRIEVTSSAVGKGRLVQDDPDLLAVVGDLPPGPEPTDPPILHRDDIDGIATLMTAWVLAKGSAGV